MNRIARVERETRETKILVELGIDGAGTSTVRTGVPFFDHMLAQLAKHGLLDLTVQAEGDTEIDAHHTVEDTALALGQALREALGDKAGIARFGDAVVPLDETLATAAVDLSGRPYLVHHEPDGMAPLIGTYDTTLTRHFFESLTATAGICLHLSVTGRNPHHLVEAQFKAVARCWPGGHPRTPAPREAREAPQGRTPAREAMKLSQRRPQVVVLDYGSGNLRSAERALARAGADVAVTADREAALAADGLVVPGVGAFAACMAGLRAVDGERIIDRRLAGGRPVLGICVGMQILFAEGVEHGVHTEGCGQWPGRVERLTAPVLPHMGWNTVQAPASSVLFAGIEPAERFYFVHSYAALALPLAADRRLAPPLLTWASHGRPFLAAAENGPLMATQFHPEKSGDTGAKLLSNWLGTLS